MINWQFTLNPANENLAIEEPLGFADNAFKLERDTKGHGISVLFTDNSLEFISEGAMLLEDYYNNFGLDAECSILVELFCDDEVLFSEEMKFDFGTFNKADCDDCRVSISFEQDSCSQQFSNNFDKKVNVDSLFTFNQTTAVRELPYLKKYSELPPKAYLKSSEANVADAGDVTSVEYESTFANILWTCRPIYANSKYESIATTQLANPVVSYSEVLRGEEDIVSPVILYEEDETCSDGLFNVTMRLKGRIKISNGGPGTGATMVTNLKLVFCKVQGSYWQNNSIDLKRVNIAVDAQITVQEQVFEFDETFTDPAMPLIEGDCLYAFILGESSGMLYKEIKQVIFDKETSVNIFGKIKCPGSKADLYMPHEVFERLADVITDGCMKFKSNFYGRTEIGYVADGEGAGRSTTNGLKLRNAPKAEFTLSMRDYFESNQAIDALGFGITTNEAGEEVLEIEKLEHFYQDSEMLKLADLSEIKLVVEPGNVIGLIKVGYDKWQVEKINGLDEFNSTREFRTTVKNTKGTLDIISKAVTSGYIIELARAENFADSGAADTTYDNETFIIQLVRDNLGFKVEQGGQGEILNVFDPESVYNFRLSPIRNLMRWWGFIAGLSFRKVENGALIFSSGTGNFLASGLAAEYTPEVLAVAENSTVVLDSVKSQRPIIRAEIVSFETPLTFDQFFEIRSNPYRYISYQCGTNNWRKGYIKSITFKLKSLKATIQLINKYD